MPLSGAEVFVVRKPGKPGQDGIMDGESRGAAEDDGRAPIEAAHGGFNSLLVPAGPCWLSYTRASRPPAAQHLRHLVSCGKGRQTHMPAGGLAGCPEVRYHIGQGQN